MRQISNTFPKGDGRGTRRGMWRAGGRLHRGGKRGPSGHANPQICIKRKLAIGVCLDHSPGSRLAFGGDDP